MESPRALGQERNGGEGRETQRGFPSISTLYAHPDIETVAAAALSRLPELCGQWLPGGRLIGLEWTCGSLQGGPGESCKVNVGTGRWSDFATGEKGGDAVSLYAAIHRCSQRDAADALANSLGLTGARAIPAAPRLAARDNGANSPPAPMLPETIRHPYHGTPSRVWRYLDAAGRLLFAVARFDPPGRRKEVLPYTWNGAAWDWKGPPGPRPLYGLPDLGARPDAPVLIVEGEKAADAARDLFPSHVAVTWQGGSSATGKADWHPLRGRSVIVWPDNDAAGQKAVAELRKALVNAGAASVAVVQIPTDWPEGWDVADTLPPGVARDTLADMLARANAEAGRPRLHTVTAAELLTMQLPQRQYALAPVLPLPGLAMLYAPRGMGKTYVALSMAHGIASGGTVLKWCASQPRRVLYVDGEMPAGQMQERLARIVRGAKMQPPEPDFLRFLSADLLPDGLPNLARPELQTALAAEMNARGAEVLILDNLSTLAAGMRENEADDWGDLQAWFLKMRRAGKHVLLIHHAGKGGQQRGTSRREDALDTVIALRRPSDYDPSQGARFEVHLEKARGAMGADAAPFSAALVEAPGGGLAWTWADLADAQRDRAAELLAAGMSIRDVAEETGLSRSAVHRVSKRSGGGAPHGRA